MKKKQLILICSLFTAASTNALNVTAQKKGKKSNRKIALVIGVANYEFANPLKNTLNDANDIAEKLLNLNFDVIKVLNPKKKEMNQVVDSFGKIITSGDICVFYYSGHGAEYNGENYLFPIDANPTVPSDLVYDAFPIGKIIGKVDFAKVKTNIIILDACRSNPFTKSWTKGPQSYEGLANIDAPNGTFIGFAASPGKTASDGAHRNGTYTEAILMYIESKNISIDKLFNRVNKEVRTQSVGKQIPYKNSSLDDDFYFNRADTNLKENQASLENILKEDYPIAPPNHIKFPLPKIKGYSYGSLNSYAKILINKARFTNSEIIEVYVSLLNENIWDRTTPIYFELNKRRSPTAITRIFEGEFKQTLMNSKIRISSSLDPGKYELQVGFYFLNELSNEYPLFYHRTFEIEII